MDLNHPIPGQSLQRLAYRRTTQPRLLHQEGLGHQRTGGDLAEDDHALDIAVGLRGLAWLGHRSTPSLVVPILWFPERRPGRLDKNFRQPLDMRPIYWLHTESTTETLLT